MYSAGKEVMAWLVIIILGSVRVATWLASCWCVQIALVITVQLFAALKKRTQIMRDTDKGSVPEMRRGRKEV